MHGIHDGLPARHLFWEEKTWHARGCRSFDGRVDAFRDDQTTRCRSLRVVCDAEPIMAPSTVGSAEVQRNPTVAGHGCHYDSVRQCDAAVTNLERCEERRERAIHGSSARGWFKRCHRCLISIIAYSDRRHRSDRWNHLDTYGSVTFKTKVPTLSVNRFNNLLQVGIGLRRVKTT